MTKIDFLIPVGSTVVDIIFLLESLEKVKVPNGYRYTVALFFDNPWAVEEFCGYSKQFKNLKVYLSDTGHRPENYNLHISNTDANCLYFLSEDAIIDSEFFTKVIEELGL